MKKQQKRMLCFFLAIGLLVTSLLIPNGQAAASAAPDKEHIWVKQTGEELEVRFDEGDFKIANLKSGSKNLILRTTYVNSSDRKQEYDAEYPWGYARIGMYAKKKGTYTVTFDVVDRQGAVRKSYSVKVYATADMAVKKVSYAGKTEFFGIAPKAKGKFKVSMAKGYKLQSITMTSYDRTGKEIVKKIKNGQNVALGKYRSKTVYNEGAQNREDWRADLLARTQFKVAYKDKYTGASKTVYYSLYRVPLN